MIDTDKMRAAYAATPLCQHAWTKRDGDTSDPTKLCAVSAMVCFAGVQPDLIHSIDVAYPFGEWVQILAMPVLRAEYGIPSGVAGEIVRTFDRAENEWRGVQEVLALCERHNMDEMHAAAINEDRARFPQHTCERRFYASGIQKMVWSVDSLSLATMDKAAWGADWSSIAAFSMPAASVSGSHKTPTHSAKGESKFWTPSGALTIDKKYTGKLLVTL